MQISISNLTFAYEGTYDNIFENASFSIDTDWRLGLIGRNGRGKTTLLKLLMGRLEYKGEIVSSVSFDYFPPIVADMQKPAMTAVRELIANFGEMERQMEYHSRSADNDSIEKYGELLTRYMALDGYIINELIVKELNKLGVTGDILERPFSTLSNGERTKCMLGALFLKKDNFLLIDEPTNHLDYKGRQIVSEYLRSKKAFILVSHDRRFLDNSVEHVLSINRGGIEVQKGNYTSWQENMDRANAFELSENNRLKKDVARLNAAARQTATWSDKTEKSKIGEHLGDRGFVGHKAAKMMKRSKTIEKRREDAAADKAKLLKNLETVDDLKLEFLPHHAKPYMELKDLNLFYGEKNVLSNISFSLEKGDRLALRGANGSGKTSLIKLLLGEDISHSGQLFIAKGLIFSYVSQDTSALKGNLKDYSAEMGIDEFLLKAILRKMGFERLQLDKTMENFSEGQKKKALIAASLCQKAHVYIWDEPLNFIDVISRSQIERLILDYEPTMIFVEHDMAFNENTATKVVEL